MPHITQKKKAIITTAILIVGSFFLFSGHQAQAYLNDYGKLWDGTLSAGEWNNLPSDFLNKTGSSTMQGPLGINIAAPGAGLQVNGPIVGTSYGGSMSAGNISSGYFGSNLGGGNYSFPGNVGIGTSTPIHALDVVGDINLTGNLLYNGNPFSSSQWLANSTAIYYNTGNVGVGTSNPNSRLTVTGGDFQIDHNRSIVVNSNLNTTLLLGNYYDGQGFGYGTSTTWTASLAVEGDVKGNRFCIKEDCKAAWTDIVAAGGGGQWTVNGSDMYNGNSGNIGIGVTAPSRKLDISGSIALPYTADANSGVIYKGTDRFIHNFALAGTDGKNTFMGINAGNFTMTGSTTFYGSYNTGVGAEALIVNTTGYNNTAFGWSALHSTNTGFNNTGLGVYAMYLNTTGSYNTAVGLASMKNNSSGTFNSALGQDSLYNNTSGSYNAAIGWGSGRFIADGATANQTSGNSVYLGTLTKALASGDTNETVIGYDAIGIGSNTVTLGNNSVVTTALKGNVGIGTTTPSVKLDVMGSFRNTLATTHSLLGGAGNVLVMADNTGTLYSTTTSAIITPIVTSASGWTANGNTVYKSDTSGNVGIGTTNPGAKLVIYSGNSSAGNIYLGAWDSDSSFNMLNLNGMAGIGNYNFLAANNNPTFYINRPTSGSIKFRENNSDQMTIAAGGNVGIGTTAPTGLLDVYNQSGTTASMFIHRNASSTGFALQVFATGAGGFGTEEWAVGTRAGSNNYSIRDTAGNIVLSAQQGGNVGINNIAPATKLDVSGSFRNTLATTHSLLGNSGNVIVMADNTGTLYSTSTASFISTNNLGLWNGTKNGSIYNGDSGAGMVGIGTTTPNNLLQVYDLITFTNAYSRTQIGYQAGKYDLGQSNTWIGFQAGSADNATGKTNAAMFNTAVGYQALYSNQTGSRNVVTGYQALYLNNSGSYNSAYGGGGVLGANTTGIYNSALGYGALSASISGGQNSALGAFALSGLTTGSYNLAFGTTALSGLTDGYSNMGLGNGSGQFLVDNSLNTTSDYGIYIGESTKSLYGNAQNEIVIGSSAIGNGNYSVTLGNDSIIKTFLKGNVAIGSTTTPVTKLDVSGSARNTLATTHSLLGGAGNVLVMADNSGTLYSTTTSAIITPIVTSASGWTASGTSVYKTDTNGNVGIGTTLPRTKLHTEGVLLVTGSASNWLSEQTDIILGRYGRSDATADRRNTISSRVDSTASGNFINFNIDDGSSTSGNPITRMTINGDGNVGIGITNPSTKLYVAGTALNTLATTHSLLGGAGNAVVMTDNTGTLYSTSTASFISNNGLGLWSGTLNGTIWNGAAGAGNVGIGIATTTYAKLAVAGAVQIGDTTDTCDANHAGAVKYNSTSKQSYICDGTRWLNQKNCGIMTDADGHTYGTVQIGGQCWQAENMNVGTMLASGATEPNNSNNIIEKWCNNSDPAQCALLGAYYNWGEAMRGSEVAGAQGICPVGWHIPTDGEFVALEKTVVGIIASPNAQYVCDFSAVPNSYQRCADSNGTDGGGVNGAGRSLRPVGVYSGNDLVGFNATYAGDRTSAGTNAYVGSGFTVWTSNPSGGSNAYFRFINGSYNTIRRLPYSRAYGFSVRCLKD